MANKPDPILFVAKYSSIDRWSATGKAFISCNFHPESFLLIFDFLDGIPPHKDTLEALKRLGNHYELIPLEGMAREDQEEIIVHRISQRSSDGKTVALIDMDDFESIFKRIDCFQLESWKSIALKNARKRIIYSASMMRERRRENERERLSQAKCTDVDVEVEDSLIRAEEDRRRKLKSQLMNEGNSAAPNSSAQELASSSQSSGENTTRTSNPSSDKNSGKNNRQSNQGKSQKCHTQPQSKKDRKSNKQNPETDSQDHKSNPKKTEKRKKGISEGLDSLMGDGIAAAFQNAWKYSEKQPMLDKEEEEDNGHTSRKEAVNLKKDDQKSNLEEKKEQEQAEQRKAIERSVLGTGSTSSDYSPTYTDYDNVRAKLLNLRIEKFVESLERALPDLAKKELSYEQYTKVLMTFVLSNTSDDFMTNWSATEPSKSFRIDEKLFVEYKAEAMYIQEMCNYLFNDTQVS